MRAIETYLNQIRSNLHLDSYTENRVIGELETYFEDKVEELQVEGFTEADATRQAICSFGRPRKVAKLLYEAHSRGSRLNPLFWAPHYLLPIYGLNLLLLLAPSLSCSLLPCLAG
jgi:hypothetical protein